MENNQLILVNSNWSEMPTTLESTMQSYYNQPEDLIFTILKSAIDEYRLSSFENFAISICVYPAQASQEVQDTGGQIIGHSRYVFDMWRQTKTMAVLLDDLGCIRVLFNDAWCPFPRFLELIKPIVDCDMPADGFSKHASQTYQWEEQSRWWQAMAAIQGKRFRLLELPPEIRDNIYSFALGEKIKPYLTHRSRHHRPTSIHTSQHQANGNLLLVSRLVYQEASDVLFQFKPFLIEQYGVAARLLRDPAAFHLQRSARLRIRQLELALSHNQFFSLFGGNFYVDESDDTVSLSGPSQAAKALREMELSKLHIKIAPPQLITESERLDGACQKIVVGWILESAWPAVRGHPVEITGFVKKAQKTTFEAACWAERKRVEFWQKQRVSIGQHEGSLKEYDEWLNGADGEEGGISLVGMVEQDIFKPGQATIAATKPECECDVPCTVESWTEED